MSMPNCRMQVFFCALTPVVIKISRPNSSTPSGAYAQVNRVSIGSVKGLSPIRCQGNIYTNARLLSIGPLGTNFSDIIIKMQNFSFTQMHLQMWSGGYVVQVDMSWWHAWVITSEKRHRVWSFIYPLIPVWIFSDRTTSERLNIFMQITINPVAFRREILKQWKSGRLASSIIEYFTTLCRGSIIIKYCNLWRFATKL